MSTLPATASTVRPSRPRRHAGGAPARILAVVALLAMAGVATLFALRKPVAVVVKPVTREVVDLVVVSGRLRAVREAAVGVEISGTIEEALVREGDRVTEGQVLARIGLIDYEAQRQQAVAKRDSSAANNAVATVAASQARSDLRRLEQLAARQLSTESDFETARNLVTRLTAAEAAARAVLAQDESALVLLDRQMAKRIVRAPFNGLITRRSVEPGQSVVPGNTLYLVAEMTQTEVFAETDEANLGRLRVGQPATVIAPAYRDQPFAARVTQLGPRVDWERGVVGVRLTPANAPAFTLPNMTVDVNIEVGRFPQAQTLPASAVLRSKEGAAVFVLAGDRFERRSLKVIGENPGSIAVEGLSADARVARDATKVKAGKRYQLSDAP